MSFIADKQTLDDLNLTGKYKPDSIYNLFNHVRTPGGERLLDVFFQHPLTDAEAINQRSGLFRYFQRKELAFSLKVETVQVMEGYLSAGGGNWWKTVAVTARRRLLGVIVRDEEYDGIKAGLGATVEVLKEVYRLVEGLEEDGPFGERICELRTIFHDKRLSWVRTVEAMGLSWIRVAGYDHVLRTVLRKEMETLMEIIYELDVYIAVARVAEEKGFCYALASAVETGGVRIHGLRHPRLDKGVRNDVVLSEARNMLFLTGANMAGKSTLMKSFGIAVYLAHMGFPVAATSMEFSVMDGLYSSINVPDDLSLGHSHFYAEVLRVKRVAQEVSSGRNFVVIFDELFKGTNVKDAYDATLAVTVELAEYVNCFFVVSTHIIEVGEALGERAGNVQFAYLPTVMEGVAPKYTYVLKEGITADRHGMMIIENEGVLDIILGGKAAEV